MKTATHPTVNETKFVPLCNGVTLMKAYFADHAFERHSHDFFAIGITTFGVQKFKCKGEHYNSQAGDFVLFNPDEDHDGSRGTIDGFCYTIWYVPNDFISSCLAIDGGLSGNRYFASPHVTDRSMAETFRLLSTSLTEMPSESLRVESLTRTFLGALLSRHGERPRQASTLSNGVGIAKMQRVKDYIRTYYQRDITVSDLAAVAGLSRAHLTRAFTSTYHTSPHVYLNAVRVAQAQTLIRHGVPLAAVAAECGFTDQSHLSRRFKGNTGATPSEWRRMNCL